MGGDRRKRALAQGCPYRHGWRFTWDTDADTRAEVLRIARAYGISMAEAVRMLIEWGLQSPGLRRTPRSGKET